MRMKVCVLGHFGEGENLLNGQTIKTKIITEELQNQLGQEQVLIADTHGGWRTLVKAPFQVLTALKKASNVVIFPAHNGLRVYAPLLSLFRPLYRKRKLHYVVIGGWLPQFLATRKSLANCLKRFDGIYVETQIMKSALEKQGFPNVYVMPNSKKIDVLTEQQLVYPSGKPYKLCTFSRVMKEKGIEAAVNAVKKVNDTFGSQVYTLDIYGQIDAQQTEWFCELQRDFPEYVRYAGQVPFDKSVDVLKKYFALLFPTYYEGEGFAGTLIDAFSAGVPVVASDWKYNEEIVNTDVGFVYPTGDQKALDEVLLRMIENSDEVMARKKSCLREAGKYRIDRVVQILIEQIETK